MYLVLFLLFFFSTLTGCVSIQSYTSTLYKPVYMPYGEFRNSFKVEKPRPLIDPGRIYLKDNFIFINEKDKGIHIIDNSDPRAPRKVAFLNILGNMDMAIQGNYLYADSHIDLLVVDIRRLSEAPLKIGMINRLEEVFPYDPGKRIKLSMFNDRRTFRRFRRFSRPRDRVSFVPIDTSKGIVVDWEKITDMKAKARFSSQACCMGGAKMAAMKGGGGDAGIGGSLARFTIKDSYLYTVDSKRLKVFSLADPPRPKALSTVNIGRNIETIFPYKKWLFIGSERGMFIYDIVQNPAKPVFISQLQHVRRRDPVVVEGNYAYVTLRDPRGLLLVVNIEKIQTPRLWNQFTMRRPFGLGVENGRLFVCDTNQVTVYDVNKLQQQQGRRSGYPEHAVISRITISKQMFDIIPFDQRLFIIGESGFHQYDYTDIKNIKFLSSILIGK
ncbi:MAG: hypothetical protein GY754_39875 [bacterium]|nr:hypothetical protein [bacterium]